MAVPKHGMGWGETRLPENRRASAHPNILKQVAMPGQPT